MNSCCDSSFTISSYSSSGLSSSPSSSCSSSCSSVDIPWSSKFWSPYNSSEVSSGSCCWPPARYFWAWLNSVRYRSASSRYWSIFCYFYYTDDFWGLGLFWLSCIFFKYFLVCSSICYCIASVFFLIWSSCCFWLLWICVLNIRIWSMAWAYCSCKFSSSVYKVKSRSER